MSKWSRRRWRRAAVRTWSPPGEVLERQRLARARRPSLDIESVRREEGKRQAIHAEGGAARMRHLAGLGAQAPFRAEMIAVIVETHAGGRRLTAAHRDEQLEFRRLLDLAHGQKLAGAAEERIARRLEPMWQAEQLGKLAPARHPVLAKGDHLIARAHGHELAHAERLKTVDVLRGFMAEAIGGDVEDSAVRRNGAARRHERIEGVAGGR